MKHTVRRETLGAALAVLALIAAPVHAEPLVPAPDAAAQLDMMAASRALQSELDMLHIKNSNLHDRRVRIYAAVTDLDGNGRLELLISRPTITYKPLADAGEPLSENEKSGRTELCELFPETISGAAYEVSADGSRLVPLDIVDGRTMKSFFVQKSDDLPVFPDLTSLHVRPQAEDGKRLHQATALRLTGEKSSEDGSVRYGISGAKYTLRMENGRLIITQVSISKGTAAVYGFYVEPYYTWSRDLATGEEHDPSDTPHDESGFEIDPVIYAVSEDNLKRNPREALADSYYSWTHDGEFPRG